MSSVEPGPLAGPVLFPRSLLPRADELRPRFSAPGCAGEGRRAGEPRRLGREMQIPGFTHRRRRRCGVAGARFGCALHSSLSSSTPDSPAPRSPDAAAALGVNSALGKSIRNAQGAPIGLQPVGGSGLRARGSNGEGAEGGRAGCPSQVTPTPAPLPLQPRPWAVKSVFTTPKTCLLPERFICWKAVGSSTSNQLKHTVGPMKAGHASSVANREEV